MPRNIKNILVYMAVLLTLTLPILAADRTTFKPAWNLFTMQQDIELGRALSDELENTLPIMTGQPTANAYILALGSQLAAHAPGEKYNYQFKIVDDETINSFALPGGFIYVTRGAIEAADSEPELAGMLAHQIAHVALRHGSQQVSKAYADLTPNSTPRRASVNSVMSRLDLHFDDNSSALKYSREAERQADLVGAQIMYDTGFDPRQMTQYFQEIGNEPTRNTTKFFDNHPAVVNRAARVRTEIQNMGGVKRTWRGDSPDFHSVQDRMLASNTAPVTSPDRWDGNKPDLPSTRLVTYRGRDDVQFRYPDNWNVYDETADSVTVAPERGMVGGAVAYGLRMATFQPQDNNRFFGRSQLNAPGTAAGRTTLARATDQLLDELRRSNPNMTVVRSDERRRVDGETAMTIELTNDSPVGERETNWLVTVLRPDGQLYYFVGVAPQRDFSRYASTFEQIVSSVRFMN